MASPSHSLGSRPNHVWGVSVSYGSTQGWNVVFPSLPRASVRRLQHLSHAGSVLRGSRCCALRSPHGTLAPHRRPMLTLRAPVIPLNQQLDLPLPEWGCCLPPMPPDVPSIAPQQLWATLSGRDPGPGASDDPPHPPGDMA